MCVFKMSTHSKLVTGIAIGFFIGIGTIFCGVLIMKNDKPFLEKNELYVWTLKQNNNVYKTSIEPECNEAARVCIIKNPIDSNLLEATVYGAFSVEKTVEQLKND